MTDDPTESRQYEFPRYATMMRNVFDFDYPDISQEREFIFNCTDILNALLEFKAYLQDAEIDPALKQEALDLIGQEIDVISYSTVSRNSVFPL